MKNNIILLCGIICTLLFGHCSNLDPVSGGATDSPNAIAGIIYNPESTRPMINIPVYLHPDYPNKSSEQLTTAENQLILDSTITDSSGAFTFILERNGTYALRAISAENALAVYLNGLQIDTNDTFLGELVLKPTGSIEGYLDLPSGPHYMISLSTLPCYAPIDSGNHFFLDNIPLGTQEYYIISYFNQSTVKNIAVIDTVSINPGNNVITDTLQIKQILPTSENRMLLDNFYDSMGINNENGLFWRMNSGAVIFNNDQYINDTLGISNSPCLWADYTLAPTKKSEIIYGMNFGFHNQWYANPAGLKEMKDLHTARFLQFKIKGSGQYLQITIHSGLISNWNDLSFKMNTPLTTEWQTVTIDLENDLAQKNETANPFTWQEAGRGMDAVFFIAAHDSAGASGTLLIDDIELLY